jgi:hypothetical protein
MQLFVVDTKKNIKITNWSRVGPIGTDVICVVQA